MKRFVLILLLVMVAIIATYPLLVSWSGGNFSPESSRQASQLSTEAIALIDVAYQDIDPEHLRDYHAHLVGAGTGETGTRLHPKLTRWRSGWHKAQGDIYFSSAGITDSDSADQQYLTRLLSLLHDRWPLGKVNLLAFDHHYSASGVRDLDRSEFYVPNKYVMQLATEHADVTRPTVSINPYRDDALQQLQKLAAQGARFIKWLPNAQGIDPADPELHAFYQAMIKHKMTLLSHAGKELAVDAAEAQALGNPLRLRYPLDLGVKVVVAHCATLGEGEDYDRPGTRVANIELFFRLMDNPDYQGRVFGDISAVTQINRVPQQLKALLARTDIHHRLINGSDYPLPAVNAVISTLQLWWYGFITWQQRSSLNELYRYNPLLYDFVLKRTIRHPQSGQQFPSELFMAKSF